MNLNSNKMKLHPNTSKLIKVFLIAGTTFAGLTLGFALSKDEPVRYWKTALDFIFFGSLMAFLTYWNLKKNKK